MRLGKHGSIRVCRAMIIMASSGTPVAAIARLVSADEDVVRDVIHAFNAHRTHSYTNRHDRCRWPLRRV